MIIQKEKHFYNASLKRKKESFENRKGFNGENIQKSGQKNVKNGKNDI